MRHGKVVLCPAEATAIVEFLGVVRDQLLEEIDGFGERLLSLLLVPRLETESSEVVAAHREVRAETDKGRGLAEQTAPDFDRLVVGLDGLGAVPAIRLEHSKIMVGEPQVAQVFDGCRLAAVSSSWMARAFRQASSALPGRRRHRRS